MGATGEQKFQLVFEAQDAASAKIAVLKNRLEELGGPTLVKSQNEIKKLERQIDQLSGTATKGTGYFTKLTESFAIGALAASAIEKAIGSIRGAAEACWNAILENEKAVTQLEGALKRLGAATPGNVQLIKAFADSMQRSVGVSDELVMTLSTRLLTAGASWAETQKAIIAANDHAAAGYGTLEENVGALATVLETGLTRGLKGLKVVVDKDADAVGNFHYALRQMSDMTGGQASKNADTLSGKVNIMKESWDRFFETLGGDNLSNFKGALDLLGKLAEAATAAYRGLKGLADLGGIGAAMNKDLQQRVDLVKELGIGADTWSKQEIAAARTVKEATAQLASETKASEGVIAQAREETAKKAAEAFTSSYKQIMDAAKISDAEQERLESKRADREERIRKQILAAGLASATKDKAIADLKTLMDGIQPMADEAAAGVTDDFQMASNSVLATMTIAGVAIDDLAAGAQAIMSRGMDNIANELVSGRGRIGDVFKGMAKDFATFFISTILKQLTASFVPKFLSILAGLFDNPVNDRMAARQGSDFARHFISGAQAQFAGGGSIAMGAINNANRIAPTSMHNSSSGGGMVYMNVTVTGNVLSDDYIAKTIKPRLQQLATDGKSALAMKREHATGARDVRFSS